VNENKLSSLGRSGVTTSHRPYSSLIDVDMEKVSEGNAAGREGLHIQTKKITRHMEGSGWSAGGCTRHSAGSAGLHKALGRERFLSAFAVWLPPWVGARSRMDKSNPDFERIVSELERNAYSETRVASEALGGLFLEQVDTKIARLKLRHTSQAAPHDWKPLIWAAKENQTAIAERLLEHGFNVNEQEDPNKQALSGYAPLHWASVKGHVEMVELLLAHGANVHVRDKHGNGPKALATKKQHTKVIALLSAAEKAYPNPNSQDGRLDAFLTAAENPQPVSNDDAHAQPQAVMTVTAVTESGAVVEGAAAPAAEGPVAADGGCSVL
jgi:hypothetical protein